MKKILIIGLLIVIGNWDLKGQYIPIIPYPNFVETHKGNFTIDENTPIIFSSENELLAKNLQMHIHDLSGIKLEMKENLNRQNHGGIVLQRNSEIDKEAYNLEISKNGVQIIASNPTGWFYGIQSLKQLFPNEIENNEVFKIQNLTIKDSPRFPWRAFMLDEARYFKGMDQVKLLLDEMAYLKMNVFHWHLTDDQGWRIEIKKYPLLTQIGAKRKSTQVGKLKWDSPIQSAEPHEGYYTQNQIKEIINYASERQITIVPEIEMPGHSSAAIAAYPWLGTVKAPIEVPIKFGVGTDVYDVSDPKVYQFLTDVLEEIIDLFPSKIIHIGGDEVKYDHWKSSKSVNDYMKNHGLISPADLQVFFTNRISNFIQNKGKRMMGWNEIIGHNLHEYQDEADTKNNQNLANNAIIHFWKGDLSLATQTASQGYDIVNSLHTDTYLDYDYKTIPLSKSYEFDPIPAGLDQKYHSNVIGLGCQMWGEWIPTIGHMHYQVFPRIAAYAEVGWVKLENKDFESFKSRLPKLQKRWDRKEIYYAKE